jgi:ABC-type polysaccharide transport system permease subunit
MILGCLILQGGFHLSLGFETSVRKYLTYQMMLCMGFGSKECLDRYMWQEAIVSTGVCLGCSSVFFLARIASILLPFQKTIFQRNYEVSL